MMRQMIEERYLSYGEARIAYVLKKHRRGGSKVRVAVSPEGMVSVSAADCMAEEDILRAVGQRGGWIWQQLQGIEQRRKHVVPRLYVDGECHFYLGRRHMLKIVPKVEVLRDTKRPLVRMLRGKIEVASRFEWSEDNTLQTMRSNEVRELLHRWYGIRAKAVIHTRLKVLAPSMPWVRKLPETKYLEMQTRWASCSSKGGLCINTHLVKAPTRCIDTILCHELCHLVEHNHSPKFWKLLTSMRPEWKRDMDHLQEMGEMYLSW